MLDASKFPPKPDLTELQKRAMGRFCHVKWQTIEEMNERQVRWLRGETADEAAARHLSEAWQRSPR
mgnify:CR=1 FL=1